MTPPQATPATPMPAAPLAQVPHGIDAAVKQLV